MQPNLSACIAAFLTTLLTIGSTQDSKPVKAEIVSVNKEPTTHTYKQTHIDDHMKAQIDCLAANIYFEARSESKEGKRAVAFVTMNRATSRRFPKTVCEVVKQQVGPVCQFSWWCDERSRMTAVRRAFNRETYQEIWKIAHDVFINYRTLPDITRGALFYHADYVHKSELGMTNLRVTARIGQHIFYGVDNERTKSRQSNVSGSSS